MKKQLFGLITLATILLSQSAWADRDHNRHGYDNYRGTSYNRNYGRNSSRHYNRHSDRDYRGDYRRSYRPSFSSGFNSYRGYRNSYRNSYRSAFRSYRNYNRGSYAGLSYGYRTPYYGRRNSYSGGDFLGGLLVGSVLTSAVSSSYYSPPRQHTTIVRPVVRSNVVVVREQSARSVPASAGRSLLRDLQGNCFERFTDEQGNQVRIQLEASECDF
jgi:hypothetical protein